MKKKHKILLTIAAAWVLIPTGTPDDILTLGIINYLGMEKYILVLLILGLIMAHYHLTPKKAQRTMGAYIKQMRKG